MIGLPSNRGPEPPDWDQRYKGFILLEHPPQARPQGLCQTLPSRTTFFEKE